MPFFKQGNGIYIFQGESLIVPFDTPDTKLQEEVNPEIARAASFTDILDSFTVPSIDGHSEINVYSLPEGELPPGWKSIPIRQALGVMSIDREASFKTARILRSRHIELWRRESRFCGSCGGTNRDAVSGELARQCNACGRLEFPRISPAVITIITNDKGEAVLANNKKFTSGVYSLIAGFSEAGENLEETVAREVKEEINLEIKNIRYIRSQAWPFPNSLMIGFAANYSAGDIRPDGIEIADARWFSRDNLPGLPGKASLSWYLISLWLDGKL